MVTGLEATQITNFIILSIVSAYIYIYITWFLKIDPVQIIGIRVCVCVCVCVRVCVHAGSYLWPISMVRFVPHWHAVKLAGIIGFAICICIYIACHGACTLQATV